MSKVFIFIDNSNTFIQGTQAVAYLEKAGQWGQQRTTRQLPNARIDYGCLLQTILNGRELGGKPLLVGSRPPPNDTLWGQIKKRGLDVLVFDRNAANKEKAVDTTIVTEVMETLYERGEKGDTVALVAGDGDYGPLIEKINKREWHLEVYFWQRGEAYSTPTNHVGYLSSQILAGASSTFANHITHLDCMYKKFMFAIGEDHTERRLQVEVSSPDLESMDNETVLQQIVLPIGDVFGWWRWVGNTQLRLFFSNGQDKKRATMWLERERPAWEVFEAA